MDRPLEPLNEAIEHIAQNDQELLDRLGDVDGHGTDRQDS